MSIDHDQHLSDLKSAILRAFPDVTFAGKITRHDGAWLPELTEENAIHDDDMLLYEALKGHKWSDIPHQFLYQVPDGFVLLTNEALVAFMGAWLMCSLENLTGENRVREYFIYTFGRKKEAESKHFTTRMLRALNPEQLAVLRLLLAEFSKTESSEFVREHADSAVELIESLSIDPQ